MRVVVYRSFAEIPPDVARKLSYPNQPEFFLSLDWYRNLHRTALSTTLEARIYLALERDEPVGALYCAERKGGRELLGLTNYYCLENGPVLLGDPADAQAIIDALLDFVAAEVPRWRTVDLRLLHTDGPEFAGLIGGLRERGFFVDTFFQFENWRHALTDEESFSTYYDARPSRMKNTIARKERKLKRSHEVELKVLRGHDPALPDAIRDFVAVYNSSWKQPEPYPDFAPSLITLCAELGILRLGLLYVDGHPAAAQLWITTNARATIYKLSYDEKYRDLSVGSILSRELFRIAIDEDNVAEIDYGVGSESYKKDWMSAVGQIRGIRAFNLKTVSGLCLAFAHGVKSLVKRSRASHGPGHSGSSGGVAAGP